MTIWYLCLIPLIWLIYSGLTAKPSRRELRFKAVVRRLNHHIIHNTVYKNKYLCLSYLTELGDLMQSWDELETAKKLRDSIQNKLFRSTL